MITLTADPATLVSKELFDRLVSRIVEDEDVDRSHAERIMGQALVFLRACADNPTLRLSPPRVVDVGWHTFIIHTAEYAAFCERVAGRFIHHSPTGRSGARPGASLARTLHAARRTGYWLDMPLWASDRADCKEGDCSQCHQGCVDSP